MRILESEKYGIKTVTLNSDLISVEIFAGKGGDIHQITYLPMDMPVLWEDTSHVDELSNRDLLMFPLAQYSELNTGGWQDVVPGLGRFGDVALNEKPIGAAALQPWNIERASVDKDVAYVQLALELPLFHMKIEKEILISTGDPTVHLKEKISNTGKYDALFTWTQHPVFGGRFFDKNTEIRWCADEVYNLLEISQNINAKPIENVAMPDYGHLIITARAVRDYFEMVNRSKNIGLRLSFDKNIFKYLRGWYQNTENGYTLALEPCSYFRRTYDNCVADGDFLCLSSGADITANLSLKFLS